MDRRDFAKILGTTAVSITALKELVPEANAIEIKKTKQYLIVLDAHIHPEICKELQEWLTQAGMNVIVLAHPDLKLYEIEVR